MNFLVINSVNNCDTFVNTMLKMANSMPTSMSIQIYSFFMTLCQFNCQFVVTKKELGTYNYSIGEVRKLNWGRSVTQLGNN